MTIECITQEAFAWTSLYSCSGRVPPARSTANSHFCMFDEHVTFSKLQYHVQTCFFSSLCLTKHAPLRRIQYLLSHHAMKTYWGNGGTPPRINSVGTRLGWVVSFMHRSLYLEGKSSLYPLNRRLGGPQSQSGCGGEEKNSSPLPGIKPRSYSP
jgi:hypothetical protein